MAAASPGAPASRRPWLVAPVLILLIHWLAPAEAAVSATGATVTLSRNLELALADFSVLRSTGAFAAATDVHGTATGGGLVLAFAARHSPDSVIHRGRLAVDTPHVSLTVGVAQDHVDFGGPLRLVDNNQRADTAHTHSGALRIGTAELRAVHADRVDVPSGAGPLHGFEATIGVVGMRGGLAYVSVEGLPAAHADEAAGVWLSWDGDAGGATLAGEIGLAAHTGADRPESAWAGAARLRVQQPNRRLRGEWFHRPSVFRSPGWSTPPHPSDRQGGRITLRLGPDRGDWLEIGIEGELALSTGTSARAILAGIRRRTAHFGDLRLEASLPIDAAADQTSTVTWRSGDGSVELRHREASGFGLRASWESSGWWATYGYDEEGSIGRFATGATWLGSWEITSVVKKRADRPDLWARAAIEGPLGADSRLALALGRGDDRGRLDAGWSSDTSVFVTYDRTFAGL